MWRLEHRALARVAQVARPQPHRDRAPLVLDERRGRSARACATGARSPSGGRARRPRPGRPRAPSRRRRSGGRRRPAARAPRRGRRAGRRGGRPASASRPGTPTRSARPPRRSSAERRRGHAGRATSGRVWTSIVTGRPRQHQRAQVVDALVEVRGAGRDEAGGEQRALDADRRSRRAGRGPCTAAAPDPGSGAPTSGPFISDDRLVAGGAHAAQEHRDGERRGGGEARPRHAARPARGSPARRRARAAIRCSRCRRRASGCAARGPSSASAASQMPISTSRACRGGARDRARAGRGRRRGPA